MRDIKRLKVILQIVAFTIFVWQIIFALLKYNDAPTIVSGGSKTISNLDKPLIVTICKTSQFDYARSPSLGYDTRTPFLTGEHNSKKMLTWTGTGNWTLNETINFLFQSGTQEENVYTPYINTSTRFLVPFGVCTVLKEKPSKLKSYKDENKVFFHLKKEGQYVVYITDAASDLHFQIQRPLSTGDQMSIDIPFNTTMIQAYYSVELTERQVKTGDGSCSEYPDKAGHTSYQDCVENENRRRTLPILGCMVPWMSVKYQCKGVLKRLPNHKVVIKWIREVYRNALAGDYYYSSACLLPCTQVTADATYLQGKKTEFKGDHQIIIYFKEIVNVETVILAYGIDSLLVEICSSLGLWLGLSVVGLFDVLLLVVPGIKQVMAALGLIHISKNQPSDGMLNMNDGHNV